MNEEITLKPNTVRRASASGAEYTGRLDFTLVLAVFILVVFGLVMLYSSSSYSARIDFGSSVYYVKRQALYAAMGFALMFAVSFIPVNFWKKCAPYFFLISCFLICLVRTPIGIEAGGAYRWIDLKIITVQPSEIVKITMIVFMAALICRFYKRMENWRVYTFLYAPCILAAGLVVLITDDLGTAVIIAVIGLVMMGISARKAKHVWLTLVIIAAVGVLFILTAGYRMERIQAWLNIDAYADGVGYQVLQGLYAIGSGGLLGKFLGNGTQKLYVPYVENDMIFSVICEELGIIGAFLLIFLYVFVLWRMKTIFDSTDDLFRKLTVAGIATHIGMQTLVNMAVVTNLLPNTGVPLPFISYGGSAIIMLLLEVGIVLKIGRGERIGKVKAPIKFENRDVSAAPVYESVYPQAHEKEEKVHGIRSWNNKYNR